MTRLTPFGRKFKIMRRIIFSLICIFSLLSCGDDSTSDLNSGDGNFYVKYIVQCNCNGDAYKKSGRADINISYAGGNDVTTKNVSSYNWSTTKGPFKKGTGIFLSVSPRLIRGTSVTTSANILISKNGGAFVNAASRKGNGNIFLNYTIK